MVSKKVVITCPVGLHIRPAAELVRLAKTLTCDVTLEFGGKSADALSVIALMSLGAKQGAEINVVCNGEDEENALSQVTKFLLEMTE